MVADRPVFSDFSKRGNWLQQRKWPKAFEDQANMNEVRSQTYKPSENKSSRVTYLVEDLPASVPDMDKYYSTENTIDAEYVEVSSANQSVSMSDAQIDALLESLKKARDEANTYYQNIGNKSQKEQMRYMLDIAYCCHSHKIMQKYGFCVRDNYYLPETINAMYFESYEFSELNKAYNDLLQEMNLGEFDPIVRKHTFWLDINWLMQWVPQTYWFQALEQRIQSNHYAVYQYMSTVGQMIYDMPHYTSNSMPSINDVDNYKTQTAV